MQWQVGGEMLVRAEATARDRVPACRDPRAEMRDRPGPERDVDERVALEDPLALCLGIAAADRDHEVGVAALAGARVAEVGGKPHVRLLADRAGVEHEHVRLVDGRRLAEAERLEHALDALRVMRVHLAAERRDVVPPHRRASVAPGRARTSTVGRSGRVPTGHRSRAADLHPAASAYRRNPHAWVTAPCRVRADRSMPNAPSQEARGGRARPPRRRAARSRGRRCRTEGATCRRPSRPCRRAR